jgi:hypothetical protein
MAQLRAAVAIKPVRAVRAVAPAAASAVPAAVVVAGAAERVPRSLLN